MDVIQVVKQRITDFHPKGRKEALDQIVEIRAILHALQQQSVDTSALEKLFSEKKIRATAIDLWKGHLPELYELVMAFKEHTTLVEVPNHGKVEVCQESFKALFTALFAIQAQMVLGKAKITTWKVSSKEGATHYLIGAVHHYPKSISLSQLPSEILSKTQVLYTECGPNSKRWQDFRCDSQLFGSVSLESELMKAFQENKRKVLGLDEESLNVQEVLLQSGGKRLGLGLGMIQIFREMTLTHRLDPQFLSECIKNLHPKMYLEREAHWLKAHNLTSVLHGKEPVCIAVGFFHCLRPGGLVDVLKKKGFTVTRTDQGEKQ